MCQILLVEDDDGIGRMVRDVLSDEGYGVEVAVEGRAALTYLQACRQLPQLILLDLVMPGMDGVQFLSTTVVFMVFYASVWCMTRGGSDERCPPQDQPAALELLDVQLWKSYCLNKSCR